MLEAEGLCKSYGAKTVVDKVSFSVVSGECLGIIGPNGAGKTTLFNALDGTVSVNRRRGEARRAGRVAAHPI